MKTSKKLLVIFSLVLLAALVLAPAALAFDGRSGERIVIGPNETINDDLYLSAREVIVEGTINGDLMAAGETVLITGKVSGDLWAAGSSVTVDGQVGDDLFAAAAAVTLGPNASIADDAFGGAASVESKSGSQVGGMFLIGASQALLSGSVTEDLLSGTNRLRLEGTIGGDAKVAVGDKNSAFSPASMNFGANGPAMPSVPAGLTFGPEAAVTGSLEYTSPEAYSVPGSVSTQVQHQLPPVDEQVSQEISRQDGVTSSLLDNVRRMIALLVVGLLVARLAPYWITGPASRLQARPLPSMGAGLLSLAAFPALLGVTLALIIAVAVLFGALTLGGLLGSTLAVGLSGLSLAAVIFFVALGYLPQAIVAYLGGRWILQRMRPASADSLYASLAVGLVVLSLLIAIPFLGGLVQFLAVLGGLGAIALLILDRRQPQAPQPAPLAAQV